MCGLWVGSMPEYDRTIDGHREGRKPPTPRMVTAIARLIDNYIDDVDGETHQDTVTPFALGMAHHIVTEYGRTR